MRCERFREELQESCDLLCTAPTVGVTSIEGGRVSARFGVDLLDKCVLPRLEIGDPIVGRNLLKDLPHQWAPPLRATGGSARGSAQSERGGVNPQ